MEEKNPLNLSWVFGFNKDIPGGVHSLNDRKRKSIVYSSGHTCIIFDHEHRTQRLLQGHCNTIGCLAVSPDKKWIVTADQGEDSMLIIWDSFTAAPIKTIYRPYTEGVIALDISSDSMYIVTLSHETQGNPQRISIWEWTVSVDAPIFSAEITTNDKQTCVRFCPYNTKQIVTNGVERVIFWSWETGFLKFFSPAISAQEFKQTLGQFTCSAFIPHENFRAITGTTDGDIVLWEEVRREGRSGVKASDKRAVKIVRLHNCSVNCIAVTKRYIITGGTDGHIRFFDFQFRIVSWFEDLDGGSITSISCAVPSPLLDSETLSGDHASTVTGQFLTEDFIVSTSKAAILGLDSFIFAKSDPKERKGHLLLQGHSGPVYGIAAHPTKPIIAATTHSGDILLWDYSIKAVVVKRHFEKLLGHCLTYNHNGTLLAVGFTQGNVRILNSSTLEDVKTFRSSKDCILNIIFSHDGTFLATADYDKCVAIFKKDETDQWVYIGKYRSHYKPITGLVFGVETGDPPEPRLLSVGEDRSLVEYDLMNSSITGGLVLKNIDRIEQTAIPTAFMWHPLHGKEDFLVTANDQYKMKLHNSHTKMCRKTLLGPTFGGPVNKMKMLPTLPDGRLYAAYGTHEKVIGMVKLPFDGNPAKSMGLIAHPREVADLTTTYDGMIVSCGGADYSINLWTPDHKVMDYLASLGGEGIDPYVNLIEGGKDGDFYEEMIQYFYYAQIHSQGEYSTKARNITGKIPLDEIPNLVRALGYYPTVQEVEDMTNEVKFSSYVDTGEYIDSINFDDFLRVYVNHRPVFGIGREDIERAFKILGAEPITGLLDRDTLVTFLQTKGETMTEEELQNSLSNLLGSLSGPNGPRLESQLTAKSFAERVLGFEASDVQDSGLAGYDPSQLASQSHNHSRVAGASQDQTAAEHDEYEEGGEY